MLLSSISAISSILTVVIAYVAKLSNELNTIFFLKIFIEKIERFL